MMYFLLATPFVVILVAYILEELYMFFYILILSLRDMHSIDAMRQIESARDFTGAHKKEVRLLTIPQQMTYYIQHQDCPAFVKVLLEQLQTDAVYMSLIWISTPIDIIRAKIYKGLK